MLINKLLQPHQSRLQQLSSQAEQQQQLLQLQQQLLLQRTREFMGTAPGLMLSFSAGCLFQLRHKAAVKTVRQVAGFGWLRNLL